MTKGIIYYTSNDLDPVIMRACQKQLDKSPVKNIISVSLKPIDFGNNIVIHLKSGYLTMVKQILTGLQAIKADVVFLAEHDVLYHHSHFGFEQMRDLYYYNVNVWRWDYPQDRAINYDYIKSQSGLCASRQLLIDHYLKRLRFIERKGYDRDAGKDPRYARVMGYEPGCKTRRQGGISDESSEMWQSTYPNIDIRHEKTFTLRKVDLSSFKHKPDKATWKEVRLKEIPGWDNIEGGFL
jgi:hypothetical protein